MSLSELTSFQDALVAVVVTYTLRADASEEFLRLAKAHAEHTLQQGRGCTRYDVVWMSASKVVFYELYESVGAFEEHASSEHLAAFRERRAPLVRHHETEVGRLVSSAQPATGTRGD